ncbi:TlpA disulfide reductase family protein [Longispora fulva]
MRPAHQDSAFPKMGSRLPAFTVRAVDGTVVSSAEFETGPALIAFFSAGCGACAEQFPALREAVAAHTYGPAPLAVVDGPTPELRAAYVAELTGFVRVIEGDDAELLRGEFGVKGWPTLVLAHDGVIRAAGVSMRGIAAALGESPMVR